MKKIIALLNQKGGVAKTTSTLNLATSTALQDSNAKVLMIDLDAQYSLTIALGYEETDFESSICNVLEQDVSINSAIYKTNIADNLFIIPSSSRLSITESQLSNKEGNYLTLRNALSEITETFDYVFIDCPPQLSLLTISALAASTHYIIPCCCEYLAYRGLKQLKLTVKDVEDLVNRDIKELGILATMFNCRINKEKEILEALKQNFNLIGTIKRSASTNSGIYDGKPAVITSKKSAVAKEYMRVAAECILKN